MKSVSFQNENEALKLIQKRVKHLSQAMAATRYWFEQASKDLRQSLVERLNQIELVRNHRLSALELDQTGAMTPFWYTSWDRPEWQDFHPPLKSPVPLLSQFGVFKLTQQDMGVEIPALVPIIGGNNLLIEVRGAAKAQANRALNALALRLLLTTSPAKLRLLLVDPVGLGQHVAGFMHLKDYMEDLVGGKAWAEARDIEDQLTKLSSHMENVIQAYLRNRYQTMEEYNLEAGEVAEPYRLLVVMNFPVNFTEEAARRLISIATNGPRCGVYVLATIDTEQPLPYGFNLADLERTAILITQNGHQFRWQDPDFAQASLTLDEPPPAHLFESLVRRLGETAQAGSRVEVPFEWVLQQVLPQETWWKASTAASIQVPIGRAGARNVQNLLIGQSQGDQIAHHVLIAGRTGSGKGGLLHALITNAALVYPPDELNLFLIDFKEGVDFKPYAEHRLPHVQVVAVETEREFGLSVLRGVAAEMKRRGELFRKTGCNELETFRRQTKQKLPRILLIIDEFQEFFAEEDHLAAEAAMFLEQLARQGRSFGIHLILVTQTLKGTAGRLPRSAMEQMGVRIVLQCSQEDSELVLAENNPAAKLLSRPGDAIYNAQNGLAEGNSRFQVAWLPLEKRVEYIQKISRLADCDYPPPIIFEGQELARLEYSAPFQKLLHSSTWPAPSKTTLAWLGEPIAIQPSTSARFYPQAGRNLIIVGRSEEMAIGMLTTALISLAVQHSPKAACFWIANLATYDSDWFDLPKHLAGHLPHSTQVVEPRWLPKLLDKLASIVQERLKAGRITGATHYLFILGLQRARDLRQEEGGYGGNWGTDETLPPSPAQQFATLLREGPEVRLHVLAWSDTYTSLERVLDRRLLGEFGTRVVMQMSGEDSTNLLDNTAATKLKPTQAIYFDEEKVGHQEKFRPYHLPDPAWLQAAAQSLKARKVSS